MSIPQGSVLGPLLFILYKIDITYASKEGHLALFADDTNIFVEGSSEEEVYEIEKTNLVLAAVHKYMIQNKIMYQQKFRKKVGQ